MYVKLFASLLDSSIMYCEVEVRYCWMCLLMLADSEGIVDMTEEAIARRIGLEEERVRHAIKVFMEPDKKSRSPEEDGRRLRKIRDSFGWQIINYEHYRNIQKKRERNEYARQWMQKKRSEEKQALTPNVDNVDLQAEAYADAKAIIPVVAKAPTPKKRFSSEDESDAGQGCDEGGPKSLIAFFRDEYTRRVGKKYSVTWGREMKLAVAALKELTFDEIVSAVPVYFDNCEPKWWSFSNFCSNFNRIQALDSGVDPLRVERGDR